MPADYKQNKKKPSGMENVRVKNTVEIPRIVYAYFICTDFPEIIIHLGLQTPLVLERSYL